MTKVWMEDKGTWLFDLAHGDLDESAVLKGFLKHYVLQDKGIGDVQQELHFHTAYGDSYIEFAMATLRRTLEDQIANENPVVMKKQDAIEVACGHVGKVIGDFLVDLISDIQIETICVNEERLVQTCKAYSQSLSGLKRREEE